MLSAAGAGAAQASGVAEREAESLGDPLCRFYSQPSSAVSQEREPQNSEGSQRPRLACAQ